MRLTLKGRIIIALLFLILVGGGGTYLYSRISGLTPGQMWHRLTSPSADGAAPATPDLTDAEIKARLLEALFDQSELRKQNVDLTVAGGVVTFTGEVNEPRHKAALEQMGQQAAGVKQVINNVAVKPSPTGATPEQSAAPDSDQQLAKKVEFTLYQTDAFDLKLMSIAAREGRVRLSGGVRNLAEKLLAERIARETEGVTEVVNELTIQSTP